LIGRLGQFPNLVILRTLSKAYGLAGARLGALIASEEISGWVRRVLPPYAVCTPAIEAAETVLAPEALRETADRLKLIRQMRSDLAGALEEMATVRKVWTSDANFLLLQIDDAGRVAEACRRSDILIRDFSKAPGLTDCLRITVGTAEENASVLACIRELEHV
jgi:histidinol-phosphate/aromatic aminotransferase/cobyric acid decarboxylase-like protein